MRLHRTASEASGVTSSSGTGNPGRTTLSAALLRRRAANDGTVSPQAAAAVAGAGASGGVALPEGLATKFGAALGADLGGVRVHTGSDSAAAAASVGARAYALGQDIHFGAGEYAPTTPAGEQLLAHEVAHTVQQGGPAAAPGPGDAQFALEVSQPGDALEVEADLAAARMVAGSAAAVSTGGVGVSRKLLQREAAPAGAPAPAATATAGAPSEAAPIGKATTKTWVNVRAGASKDAAVLAQLNPGDSVEVFAVAGSWLQIVHGAGPGFITGGSEYVSYVELPPPAPTSAEPATETGTEPAAETGGVADQLAEAAAGVVDTITGAVSSGIDMVTGFFGGATTPSEPTPPEKGQLDREAQGDAATESSELDELMANERLDAAQIARARELIGELPEAERGPLFLELQDKVEYLNQVDNESAQETVDAKGNPQGGTCNLTSVAMALMNLGIVNPEPDKQFEDVLVSRAKGDIKSPTTWEAVAQTFGVTMKYVLSEPGLISRAQWNQVRDDHLAAGQGVVLSIRGHVVRVQAVTEQGVMVDDPFGLSTLAESKRVDRNGEVDRYSWESNGINTETGEGANKGEDHTWPWADVDTYEFKYMVAFSK